MKFYKAEITDLLRCSQRDGAFVNELQNYLVDMLKLLCGSKYNTIRQYIPICANSWYYLLTSVSNFQTLGEEYTGTIRITNDNEIPSTLAQLVWLALFIGGDKLFDNFFAKFGKHVYSSTSLTTEAKTSLLKLIDFIKEHKYIILRLHQSIFYIYGTYHNFANRLTGIKYVLLRKWMQDTSAAASFNILGKISILYLVLLIIDKIISQRNQVVSMANCTTQNTSSNVCVLCVENCKNVCATPCGHLFCWECIYDSLKYQPTCPICRETVNPSRIIFLQNYY